MLHGDHFRITVEPVIVKRYRKTLVNKGFCKKKLDTRIDTHCIKTGVQLWQRMRDSNPRKRSQSPVCYRYTNPLCISMVIIPIFSEMSSEKQKKAI